MANIKVNELNSAGTKLLTDAESFMNELDNAELNSVVGGFMSIDDGEPDPPPD